MADEPQPAHQVIEAASIRQQLLPRGNILPLNERQGLSAQTASRQLTLAAFLAYQSATFCRSGSHRNEHHTVSLDGRPQLYEPESPVHANGIP